MVNKLKMKTNNEPMKPIPLLENVLIPIQEEPQNVTNKKRDSAKQLGPKQGR